MGGLAFFALLLAPTLIRAWNEADEAARIRQINEEELRAFEDEMRPANQAKFKTRGFYNTQGQPERWVDAAPPRQEPGADAEGNWCYSCVTPIGRLSNEMQISVKKFLNMRRTEYPKDLVNQECLDGRNVSRIKQDKCLHKYCATIVLNDHNQGASFVLRGCAEKFGAITPTLEALEENTCRKLHENLDMRECICKNRHFCYSGSFGHRHSSASSTPLFGAALALAAVLL